MKKELKSRGCVVTGKKQDFVERLQAYDAAKRSSQIANFVRPYNEQQKRVESAKKISELEDVYQDWKNVVDPNDSLGTDYSFETLRSFLIKGFNTGVVDAVDGNDGAVDVSDVAVDVAVAASSDTNVAHEDEVLPKEVPVPKSKKKSTKKKTTKKKTTKKKSTQPKAQAKAPLPSKKRKRESTGARQSSRGREIKVVITSHPITKLEAKRKWKLIRSGKTYLLLSTKGGYSFFYAVVKKKRGSSLDWANAMVYTEDPMVGNKNLLD